MTTTDPARAGSASRADAGPSPFGMTDLEESLQGPEGRQVRAALLSRLSQIEASFDAMVRRGLAQDQFRRAEAIMGAVTAARTFLSDKKPTMPSTRR